MAKMKGDIMHQISLDEIIRILTWAEAEGFISGNIDYVIEAIISEATK